MDSEQQAEISPPICGECGQPMQILGQPETEELRDVRYWFCFHCSRILPERLQKRETANV